MINQNRDINLSNKYILDYKTGDVTGDGFTDQVYLTGRKNLQGQFIDNVSVIVQDYVNKMTIRIPIPNAAGYNPQLFLGQFTVKSKQDILVNIETGGSGGYILVYLFTLINYTPQLLLNSESFDQSSIYNASFKDNFKVNVKSADGKYNFIIDVSFNKKMYVEEGIYTENGKLVKPTEGGVLSIGALYPVIKDYNGLYQLLAYQRIIGINNADNLGAVETYLKWDNGRFIADRVSVSIMEA